MKKKILMGSAVLLYLAAFLLIGFYFYMDFSRDYGLSPSGRVMVLLGSCLAMYPGGVLLSKAVPHRIGNRALRWNLVVWLALYVILLCTLTLFDETFSRGGLRLVAWNRERLDQYLRYSFNPAPFATIWPYVAGFAKGELAPYIFVYNILGNIAALMPFGFFLPLLFGRQERFGWFLLTMVGIVAVIELLQFATLSGSCDIDDLILNVLGASAMFALLRIKGIRRLVRRIFLLE